MKHLRILKSKGLRSIYLATSSMMVGGVLAASGTARAEVAPAGEAAQVGDIIVTASRRSESVTKLPFNISAYGSQQLQSANITSVTALSQQVPNFVITDAGPGRSANSIPIIRGINASPASSTQPRYFQSPVGFYLGNVPMTGSFPLMDVDRIEVLRGPQGTLYGAGALAGAVRIIPTEPKLGTVSGTVSGSVGVVSHSRQLDNDQLATINLPVGENAAFRVVARREYSAGFIDQNDIMRRESGAAYALPTLADPTDVAFSPANYYNKKDVNDAESYSTRASFVWKPDDRLKLLASYSYFHLKGNGTPTDNHTYPGGPSKIDPRRTLAATGEYEISSPALSPYTGEAHLASLDLSYDLGFATLSGTAAYGRTKFEPIRDNTIGTLGSGFLTAYYAGNPANPRFLRTSFDPSKETNYTQEVRLVSKSGGPIDYTVGAFAQQQKRFIGWNIFLPGADIQSAAAHDGSMIPILEGGTWVGPFGPNNMSYIQNTHQKYRDYSIYGDVTWHITPSWQVTGGARLSRETFNQNIFLRAFMFPTILVDAQNKTKVSSQIFKANTSYQFAPNAQVYATFSQGFRRGGANTFPTTTFDREPEELLVYGPDKTNNYEVGLKGRASGISFSADLFYVDWQNPQIDTSTPYNGYNVVINGKAAVSKGAEMEISGPIGESGLSFSLGLAYARARLTKDFALPAGDSASVILQNAIIGVKGARLPGAPDFSGSGNLYYKFDVGNDSAMTLNFGADYRSSVINDLSVPNRPNNTMKGYALLHASVQWDVEKWQLQLFANNLADTHAIISKAARSLGSLSRTGALGDSYLVTRPRQVGLRVTRNF